MTYKSTATGGPIDEVSRLIPSIFWPRLFEWGPYVSKMDTMASYPTTLDTLAALVTVAEPKVLVEAGTYRGHSTFAMAEVLYLNRRDAHLWTADIINFSVQEVLDDMRLSSYVTFYLGSYEAMLAEIPDKIDFAYIDASSKTVPELRVTYLDLTLERMNSGGLIIVDDAASDEPIGAALRERANLFLPHHHGLAIFQAP